MIDIPLKHIFIQAKVPSKKLIIVLHGRGDSSYGFTWLPPTLGIDDMNYILLDAPYDYFTGHSWYDLPPKQLKGIKHSSVLLTQTLDILFEKEFHAEKSFLFGFSQGSLLAFEFGARYHKILAGYVAISGYIYDANALLNETTSAHKKASWLCTHGRQDDVLPFHVSKEQVTLLQDGGFNITFKSYAKVHTIIEDEVHMVKEWIYQKFI